MNKTPGKAIPYGVYDVAHHEGWVSVGIDHDTARLATEALRRWWKKMGSKRYPNAKELLITADGGGSNGSRSRLWKAALQTLAKRAGGGSRWRTRPHEVPANRSLRSRLVPNDPAPAP